MIDKNKLESLLEDLENVYHIRYHRDFIFNLEPFINEEELYGKIELLRNILETSDYYVE
jgi:hypothetical protein